MTARNLKGKAILYADSITKSMEKAITETNRRREKQMKYNQDHGIVPQALYKGRRVIGYWSRGGI